MPKDLGNIEDLFMDYVFHKHQPKLAKVGFGFVNGIILSISFVFFILAGFFWLSNLYTTDIAALMTAGGLITVSVLFTIGTRIYLRRRKLKELKAKQQMSDTVEQLAYTYADDVIDIVQKHPKSALFASVVAGFIASERM